MMKYRSVTLSTSFGVAIITTFLLAGCGIAESTTERSLQDCEQPVLSHEVGSDGCVLFETETIIGCSDVSDGVGVNNGAVRMYAEQPFRVATVPDSAISQAEKAGFTFCTNPICDEVRECE